MATRAVGTGSGGDPRTLLDIIAEVKDGSLGDWPPVHFDTQINGHSQYQIDTLYLAPGDNTVTVPITAAWAVLVPPGTNTIAWRFKATAGDTGKPANPVGIEVCSFVNPPPATFILNAGNYLRGFTVMFG